MRVDFGYDDAHNILLFVFLHGMVFTALTTI